MRFSVLLVILLVAQAQEEQQKTQAEIVRQREQEIRSQNNMTYTNIRSYTFVCGRFDDFILKPQLDHEIKFEMHVYWKQENVYVSAQYREGEEIRVIVYEDNQRVLLDRQFYMTTGFTFAAKKNSSYTVRFLAAGKVTKLLSMLNSSPLQVSDKVATKQHINSAQQKVDTIGNQLKALLTISQRNFIMKEQVSNKILSNTKLYMGYQVVEVILIIGVAVLQVTSLTKLLRGGSIV